VGFKLLNPIEFESNMPYKDKNSPEAKASSARRNKKYYDKNKKAIMAYKKTQQAEYRKEYYERNKDRMKKQGTDARRKRLYGCSPETFVKIMEKQGYRCAICRRPQNEIQQNAFCIDHCHETGKLRGALCHDCNVAIGRFDDNIKRLKSAIIYLSSHA